MTDNIVFLAHTNDSPISNHDVVSCRHCGNKTWKASYGIASQFPKLQCSCCGSTAGFFGWIEAEDAMNKDSE